MRARQILGNRKIETISGLNIDKINFESLVSQVNMDTVTFEGMPRMIFEDENRN